MTATVAVAMKRNLLSPTSWGSTESTDVVVVGISKVDGVAKVGRSDSERDAERVSVLRSTLRIGDRIASDFWKRVG